MAELDSGEPTDEEVMHLYAWFGRAYFHSECLHKELCHLWAKSKIPTTGATAPRVNEILAEAYALTLGKVAERCFELMPADLAERLRHAIEQRNFLAHSFWFERNHLMYSRDGVAMLIAELSAASEAFHSLDIDLQALVPYEAFGLSEEIVQELMQRTLGGEPMEPLPGQRRLKKRERLVAVFEAPRDGRSSVLIFQLDDGTLWQLCDVGLGWTSHETVDPNWPQVEVLKPWLPCEIEPRPSNAQSWRYEIPLGTKAHLRVWPHEDGKQSRWNVRPIKKS